MHAFYIYLKKKLLHEEIFMELLFMMLDFIQEIKFA